MCIGVCACVCVRNTFFSFQAHSQNFEKRLLTSSFLLSVCASVCVEQLGSHGTDFHEILYLSVSKNLSRKFKFHWFLTRITRTLHEDQYTYLIISRSVLSRVKNVSDSRCREHQNTHFMFNNFFLKPCRLWDNVEKYCRAGLATDDNMAHANCLLGT